MSTPISQATTATLVASALFVDITLGDTTYYLSDAYKPIEVDSNTYTQLGALLGVSDIKSDYSATQGTTQITISGIPNNPNYTNLLLNSKIKGGEITVRRVFFDTDTLAPSVGGAYLRFRGVISNYNIQEETDIIGGSSVNTLILECASVYAILQKKISGERTNGGDRRRFNPATDTSFDNVVNINVIPEMNI